MGVIPVDGSDDLDNGVERNNPANARKTNVAADANESNA
jgi:hypothetical protein